jgi:hypothetical protein
MEPMLRWGRDPLFISEISEIGGEKKAFGPLPPRHGPDSY